MSITATCLCGDVSYAIEGPLREVLHCHCETCRKAHGAPFRSRASAPIGAVRWIRGEQSVSYFESSPGVQRGFCRRCGSPMLTRSAFLRYTIGVPISMIDQDAGLHPSMHIFVRSKVPWIEILDGLPQFETVPCAESWP